MPDLSEHAYRLGRVPLFARLGLPDLLAIARLAEEVTAAPGTELFSQGAVGDALFVVLDGAVAIELDGREVNVMGPGQSFGEIAVLDGAPRTATARVSQDLLALRLGRQAFAEVLAERPAVRRAVLAELAARLLAIEARVLALEQSVGQEMVGAGRTPAEPPAARQSTDDEPGGKPDG